jgi:hypothetical protein
MRGRAAALCTLSVLSIYMSYPAGVCAPTSGLDTSIASVIEIGAAAVSFFFDTSCSLASCWAFRRSRFFVTGGRARRGAAASARRSAGVRASAYSETAAGCVRGGAVASMIAASSRAVCVWGVWSASAGGELPSEDVEGEAAAATKRRGLPMRTWAGVTDV